MAKTLSELRDEIDALYLQEQELRAKRLALKSEHDSRLAEKHATAALSAMSPAQRDAVAKAVSASINVNGQEVV